MFLCSTYLFSKELVIKRIYHTFKIRIKILEILHAYTGKRLTNLDPSRSTVLFIVASTPKSHDSAFAIPVGNFMQLK